MVCAYYCMTLLTTHFCVTEKHENKKQKRLFTHCLPCGAACVARTQLLCDELLFYYSVCGGMCVFDIAYDLLPIASSHMVLLGRTSC